MAELLLEDGPCDNKRLTVSDSEVEAGTFTCGGATYRLQEGSPGNWFGFFEEATGLGANNDTGLPDSGLHAAWQRLLHGAGHTVPDHINASVKMRQQLRRLGRH